MYVFKGFKVRWKIKERSSGKINLNSIPGLQIYNPLVFASTYADNGLTSVNGNYNYKGEVFINTFGLLIESSNQMEWKEIVDSISDLFKYVRSSSLQFDINNREFVTFHEDKKTITKRKIAFPAMKEFGTWNYKHLTTLDWVDFKKIDTAKSKGKLIPIHREIVIDAISAHFDYDYRKSILYFCMACETIISSILYDRYEELKKKNKLKNSVTESGQVKDPVYEILRQNKRQFKFKLHEHYLHLFDKSLKIDDNKLFENLIKLYNTRNKIVHEGEIKVAKDHLLSIDEAGSNEAFNYTINFFSWFGDDSLKTYEKRKFIIVK